jgi:hypothetical protein
VATASAASRNVRIGNLLLFRFQDNKQTAFQKADKESYSQRLFTVSLLNVVQ